MKLLLCTLLCGAFAIAQTSASETPVLPSTPVDTSALPAYTLGVGPSWQRGNTYPLSLDTNLAVHIGSSRFYSWTTISTPIATVPAGSSPLPSTITSGGAWVAAQSPTGSVSLIFIGQAGFSTLQATGAISPAFTGDLGIAFRLGRSHTYLMPYARASNTTTGTNGALATAIFQPGVMLLYGFGGK